MKKLIIVVISLLCLTPAAFAGNWGLGFRAGATQNDPETMHDCYKGLHNLGYDIEFNRGYSMLGTEAFYEGKANFGLGEGEEFWGIKLGVDFYGENKLKLDNGLSANAQITDYAIPLTLYYKNDLELDKVSSYYDNMWKNFLFRCFSFVYPSNIAFDL